MNKVIYIAAVSDIPEGENHNNMSVLFNKTNLKTIKFSLASDLKLHNIILGLSSHVGKHCCLYCNGVVGICYLTTLIFFNEKKNTFMFIF